MNNVDLKVDTNGDSPRGWEYALLHSPKSSLLSPAKLPFMILFFGAGVFLGATWNKAAYYVALPKDDYVSFGQTSNEVAAVVDKSYLRKANTNSTLPIAWLMSFPNSGTSYTSYLVRSVSGKNTASNYGTENVGEDGTSVAVFEDSPNGPFWSDPLSSKYVRPTSGYLLTKTHCGGRCDQCPVQKYVENCQIFTRRCFEGYHIVKDASGEGTEKVLGSYSKDLVAKAVHLIRDPFDNIVSRFHLSYKHFIKKNHTDKLALYPRSRAGFRAFCRDLGERFYEQEKASKFYRDVFDDVKDVACHADFFRYIQWHSLAFATTWDLDIPTMIIHYENYTRDLNQTKDLLLEFLEQDNVNPPPYFETGKTYREYFNAEEIEAVANMFQKLGSDKMWAHTKHYFA